MKKITIIGAGNLGLALALGIQANKLSKGKVRITKRNFDDFPTGEKTKFICMTNNIDAIKDAEIIVIAVQPKQLEAVLKEISSSLTKDQLLISVVTGAKIEKIKNFLGETCTNIPIVRAMPNTSLKTGNSMTCLAFNEQAETFKDEVQSIFNLLGKTLILREEMFASATVLCGSGIAIVLKFIRAYMQAGIQSGLHEKEALQIAMQVTKGAAILLEGGVHPEVAIDQVTTPGGCTIDTLIGMEHFGFSSALLKAMETGIKKAQTL